MSDISRGVLGAVLVAAALAIGALVVYRPWRKVVRGVRGHELTVHVETDLRRMELPAGVEAPYHFWLTSEPPAPKTPMHGEAEWAAWARALGGHDVRVSVIQVTVQGVGQGPVSVEPPELVAHRSVERSADGAVYGPGGLGGNGIHTRRYIFTLDNERVSRRYVEDPDERPASFSIGLGETQRLTIVVRAVDDKRHLWGIDLPVIFAGKRQTLRIRWPDGSPFVTYGGIGQPVRMLVDGAWLESPPMDH